MNLTTLKMFIHLCDSKSFHKTALAVHISPSALSRQIQKLEASVGQSLLLRDNRSVELTEAGRKLLPVALRITTEWQQLCQQLHDGCQELTGELRMFCSVTASYTHLPDLLSTFRIHHPQIEYKLSTGDPAQAIEKVESKEVDIALSAMPDSLPTKLEFATIGEIPLSVIAPRGSSPFIDELRKSQPDWSRIPFIIPEAGTARERANTWFSQMGIKPTIYAKVAGHEAIVSMVALGCGVGIVPDVVINSSPVKARVQKLNVAPLKPFKIGLCCLRSQLNHPLVKALWSVATKDMLRN